MIALAPDEILEVVLPEHREEPEATRPVLLCRAGSVAFWRRLRTLVETQHGSDDLAEGIIRELGRVVTGGRNLRAFDGAAVEWTGPETLLEIVSDWGILFLVRDIRAAVALEDFEKKVLRRRSPSAAEESAGTADPAPA